MIPRPKDYVNVSWPETNNHRVNKDWDRSTHREILEGLIEFTGREVPHKYWKYHKSNPILASESIGGNDFAVRRNPANGRWETVRMVSPPEESGTQNKPMQESRKLEFVLDLPESNEEIKEKVKPEFVLNLPELEEKVESTIKRPEFVLNLPEPEKKIKERIEPRFILDLPELEDKVKEGIEEVKMEIRRALDKEIKEKEDEIQEMMEEEKIRKEIEIREKRREKIEREKIEAQEILEEETQDKIREEIRKNLEEEARKREIVELEAMETSEDKITAEEFPDSDEFSGGEEYRVESSI